MYRVPTPRRSALRWFLPRPLPPVVLFTAELGYGFARLPVRARNPSSAQRPRGSEGQTQPFKQNMPLVYLQQEAWRLHALLDAMRVHVDTAGQSSMV